MFRKVALANPDIRCEGARLRLHLRLHFRTFCYGGFDRAERITVLTVMCLLTHVSYGLTVRQNNRWAVYEGVVT
jgi:hypothetical protein